ncbi:MAG TPA: hypothetical protein VGC11_13090 [Acidimicrobiia bacterium]|jgi:hypothetical protein
MEQGRLEPGSGGDEMVQKRGLAIMATAFVVVLLGGVAFAQIGSPATPGDPTTTREHAEPGSDATTTTSPTRSPKPERPSDHDFTPPRFAILRPEDGARVDRPQIEVSGKVEAGAKVTFGDRLAEIDAEGHWGIRVHLAPGANHLVLVATDRAGNSAEDAVTVHYVPAPEVEFTAHQKREVVDGDPAVNGYWGTAAPGAAIHVASDYGRGATEANHEGNWELRVEFPDAPCNQAFSVVVESRQGRAEFRMKRACRTEVEFTAHQKYGSCDETVPYDVFFGTAAPGTEIWVESGFGRGHTVAGENGEWRVRVEFPDSPVGVAFDVVIESSAGHRKVFSFVHLGAEHGG